MVYWFVAKAAAVGGECNGWTQREATSSFQVLHACRCQGMCVAYMWVSDTWLYMSAVVNKKIARLLSSIAWLYENGRTYSMQLKLRARLIQMCKLSSFIMHCCCTGSGIGGTRCQYTQPQQQTGTQYDILWYTVVYCDILWHTVVYCGILWYTVVYCDVLWCTVIMPLVYMIHTHEINSHEINEWFRESWSRGRTPYRLHALRSRYEPSYCHHCWDFLHRAHPSRRQWQGKGASTFQDRSSTVSIHTCTHAQ